MSSGSGTSSAQKRRRLFLVCYIAIGVASTVVASWWVFAYPHRWNNLGTERGRYQRTRSDLAAADRAIQSYAAMHDQRLPVGSRVLTDLASHLQPTFTLKLPGVDVWNQPFHYSSDGTSWELRSLGRDGVRDPPHGQAPILDQDLIRRNGQEVRTELIALVEEMALP